MVFRHCEVKNPAAVDNAANRMIDAAMNTTAAAGTSARTTAPSALTTDLSPNLESIYKAACAGGTAYMAHKLGNLHASGGSRFLDAFVMAGAALGSLAGDQCSGSLAAVTERLQSAN
ncbi:hypothetical protein OHA37_25525 [Streptomyces sp. NBC_00335]|uniref:hypothetical protein n=1 Tax=unclassified Streptomyces TaxID=2593676 RepID=UPI002255E823|nr:MULTISPECIES: hypothetical protein [unclassified Streptomyces]MCX5407216.1 hypothetical protein [Streptomyces sp. NBC_00086]